MEIKINKNLTDYEEKYFGLTMRQLFWGAISLGSAIATYIFVGAKVHNDVLQIFLTFLVAAPSAGMGFFKYNGMNFVQFIKVFYRYTKSPRVLVYSSKNLIYERYKTYQINKKKEVKKDADENNERIEAEREE